MRKSRFSEEQMVGILREADRDPLPQVDKRTQRFELENAKLKG